MSKINEAMSEIMHICSKSIIADDQREPMKVMELMQIAEIARKTLAAYRGTSAAEEVASTLGMIDEPAAEVPRCRTQQEYFKQHYSICDGMFPIRRGNSEECVVESCWVDKHRFTAETVVTEKVDGVNRKCEFTIRDNGKIKVSGHFHGGKALAEKVAHAALKAYITDLSGNGKHKSRGDFLKQALKRLTEQRGKDSAAPVKEEAVNG